MGDESQVKVPYHIGLHVSNEKLLDVKIWQCCNLGVTVKSMGDVNLIFRLIWSTSNMST